jgi:hypothetical protein
LRYGQTHLCIAVRYQKTFVCGRRCSSRNLIDPSTSSADQVQAVLSNLEDNILGPYETPSNKLSRNMYDHLLMPWDTETTAFLQSNYKRLEWNRNGKLEANESDFFEGSSKGTLQELADSLGTASMVTRWREANPSLVGTENDCVSLTMRRIAEAMGAEGIDLKDIILWSGSSTTLLMFTRIVEY